MSEPRPTVELQNLVVFGSSRFCVYPQEIIMMLQESMRIRKLQILAHQYLIRKFAC